MLRHLPEFTHYLTLKHLSPSTIARKKRDITQLESHLVPLKLHHIEPAHLEDAILSLKQSHNLTPVTIRHKRSSLKSFFTFLHDRGYLKNNFAASLPSPSRI